MLSRLVLGYFWCYCFSGMSNCRWLKNFWRFLQWRKTLKLWLYWMFWYLSISGLFLQRRKPHETQWYIFILYFLFYNDAAQIRKCFELQSFICRNCASVATVLIRICSFVTSLFLDFLRCPWQVQALLLLLGECDIPSTVPSSAFAQPQNIMVLLYTILLSFKRIFLSIWISLSTFSVFHLSEWWQCLQWLKAFTKNCFFGEVSWKTKRKKLWKKNSV